MGALHIGCSGWQYTDWRGVLYPDGLAQRRWLERYAEEFDTVEVNSTFYRLASPKAVAAWLEQTPDDFVFSVKASRYLTHVKRLRGIGQGVRRFYAAIKPLVDTPQLGPLLWQLPENFHRDDERLGSALKALEKRGGRHAFEFRHPSWFEEEVYGLLRSHGAALVIGDDPDRSFQAHELTTDWTFIRFHRGNRGRGGNYSKSELDEWATRIKRWRRRADVYAYFNNDWRGYAVKNARYLTARLG
jgi:uncharacterized protein YecE (DUF72 family)